MTGIQGLRGAYKQGNAYQEQKREVGSGWQSHKGPVVGDTDSAIVDRQGSVGMNTLESWGRTRRVQ